MAHCNRCGTNVKEGIVFCPECGCKIVNKPPTDTNHTSNSNRTNYYSPSDKSITKLKVVLIIKIIICLIGIIFGIGFLAWHYQCEGNLSGIKFGGDFYTEIYDVTEKAAKYIAVINGNITLIGGYFFIFSSAFCLICSIGSYYKGITLNKISKSLDEIKSKNKE